MSSPTPQITGTDFVGIAVSDIDASVAFYRDVLGLRESKRWGAMPAVEFETGSLTLALMQADSFGLETGGSSHSIALHVDDYEAAHAALEASGVEFTVPTIDSGVCLQAYFQDPDGNALGIHHRYGEGTPPATAG